VRETCYKRQGRMVYNLGRTNENNCLASTFHPKAAKNAGEYDFKNSHQAKTPHRQKGDVDVSKIANEEYRAF
jgi:hypothetical protein